VTIGTLIETLAARFDAAGLVYGHGTDNGWDEAVALVLAVTGAADRQDSLNLAVAPEHHQRVEALAARRIGERLPLPYLLGHCRFAGLDFDIEPGVVIPRSPIAELLGRRFAPWWQPPVADEALSIIDVCCGSGCIGIALARAFPASRVMLIDLDPGALELARRNVQRHGLSDRVAVVAGDLLSGIEAPVHLIVSNPPYVDAAAMAALPPEYRHEPERGLAGGEDGLDLVVRLLEQAAALLPDDGLLVCEVGASAVAVDQRLPRLVPFWPDLAAGGEGVFMISGDALRAGTGDGAATDGPG